MSGPRLRTVNKAVPPYQLGKFPAAFIETFAQEIVYMLATKSPMNLEGDEWEQIFSKCINAEWKPSNVGLDDVQLDNCCWSAKTVYGNKNLGRQKKVRLISGRNSLTFSFGEAQTSERDPDETGRMILDIWNERVSGIRQYFKFARTVVLVKAKDYSQFLVFETETIRYDADMFYFKWNKDNNLEGYDKQTHFHKFTWQPSGGQFTIIEEIPEDRLHIQIRHPDKLDKDSVLAAVGYNSDWYYIV